MDIQLYTSIRYAYKQAIRGKKDTLSIDGFRCHEETNLIQLYNDLIQDNYKPGKATFFIIRDPVQREICAAPFRDRIIHHLIYSYLNPIFDPLFIADSYGARLGKGTHYGIQKTLHHLRQCTNNKTKLCRVMKIDIQGFFMNIHQDTLLQLIYKRLLTYTHKPHVGFNTMPRNLRKRIKILVKHRPTNNYHIKGSVADWKGLPKEKSIFSSSQGVGLPLGNLTSQLFANIYLDPLDKFIKHTLKIKYYGRYMDDMVLIHKDKHILLDAKKKIQDFMCDTLHLTLHPQKLYLQQSHKGVPFVGYRIFPWGYMLGKRTINKWRSKTITRNEEEKIDLQHVQASYNSYLGLARHGNNYKLRKQMIHKLNARISNGLHSSGGYKKLVLRTKKVPKKYR